jgi:hypothetical protein
MFKKQLLYKRVIGNIILPVRLEQPLNIDSQHHLADIYGSMSPAIAGAFVRLVQSWNIAQ